MRRPELSLVIPIYNEEAVLPQLDVRLKELLKTLGVTCEVVFVNDGSKDQSMELLRRMAAKEPRYRVVGFSRNFGHQRAITAGVDKSRGQAVVVMDADLQDPPEVILEMVEKWHAGYDVVYGRRRSRAGESWFKLTTAKMFYRVFAMLIPIEVPLDTGDFRLMSRRVVQTMRGLRETHRFVRGLVAWVGFKQTAVEYDRHARAAGETKYPLRKMIAFAIDGIASFSIQPLRMASYFGLFVGTASVLYAVAAVISWYAGLTVPGWTTTVVLVSFLFSVQFFLLGVLGEYVGRIYEQVKRRPLYIISERINFEARKIENLATENLDSVEEVSAGVRTPRTARSPEGPAPGAPPTPPDTKPGLPADPASVDVPPPPAALVAAQTAQEKELVASSGLSKPPPKGPPAKPAAPKLSSSVANIHAAPPAKPSPSAAPPPVKATPSAAPSKVSPSLPPPVPKAAPKVGASTPPPPPKVSGSVPPPAPKITPSAPPPKVTPSVPPPAPKVTPSVPPPKVTPSVPPVASAAADTQKTVSPFATKDKKDDKDAKDPPDTKKDGDA